MKKWLSRSAALMAVALLACASVSGAPAQEGRRAEYVPATAGVVAGAAVEAIWGLRQALGRSVDIPPMTRFLADQLSTAHWFDQRETRQLLGWRPRVDLATGFERLAACY